MQRIGAIARVFEKGSGSWLDGCLRPSVSKVFSVQAAIGDGGDPGPTDRTRWWRVETPACVSSLDGLTRYGRLIAKLRRGAAEQEQLADHDRAHGLFLSPRGVPCRARTPGSHLLGGLDLYVIPLGSFKSSRPPQHTHEIASKPSPRHFHPILPRPAWPSDGLLSRHIASPRRALAASLNTRDLIRPRTRSMCLSCHCRFAEAT